MIINLTIIKRDVGSFCFRDHQFPLWKVDVYSNCVKKCFKTEERFLLTVFRGNGPSGFRFCPLYKDLMLRTGGIIYSGRIDRPKFCPSRVSRRHRRNDAHFLGRLIFRRTRHININSMYEICQNEFRLGAAGPPDHHFSSRGECDLDVKYRCIIARAREEYQVGRFPLSRFFRIIRSSARTHLYVWREIRSHQSVAFYLLFFHVFVIA